MNQSPIMGMALTPMMMLLLLLLNTIVVMVSAGDFIIYDDQLNPNFRDYSWGHVDLQNTIPVYEGSKSIKFTAQNFQGLFFTLGYDLDRSKYSGISFYVNPGDSNPSPHIAIQLTRQDQSGGPKLPLISKSNPSNSATGLTQLPLNTWTRAFLPFPNNDEQYSGLQIISRTSQGLDLYIDKITVMDKKEEILEGGSRVSLKLPEYLPPRYYPISGKIISAQTMLIPGSSFMLNEAYLDPSFGVACSDGHVFWTSAIDEELDSQRTWNFIPNTGRLNVLADGNIQIIGIIYPIEHGTSSCHTWEVSLNFYPTSPPTELKDELNPESYVPLGPIDPNSWTYFALNGDNSKWTGTGCNHGKVIPIIGMQFNSPLQIGYGANGRNGNLGLSVWLTFKTKEGICPDPIDINCDMTLFSTPQPTPEPTLPPPQTPEPTEPCIETIPHSLPPPPPPPPSPPPTETPCIEVVLPTLPPTLPPTQPPCDNLQPCTKYHYIVSIDGYVFVDLSTEGRYNPERGEPLGPQEISVQLYNRRGYRAIDIHGNTIPTQITNSMGYFVFSEVPPGEYYLYFKGLPSRYAWSPMAGTNPWSQSWVNSQGLTPLLQLTSYELRGGSANPDGTCSILVNGATILAGMYPNIPIPIAFGSTVFKDVNNNGVYDLGTDVPIPNVVLNLLNPDGTLAVDLDGTPIPAVLTNEDGKYWFDNVPSGEYMVFLQNLPWELSNSPKGVIPANPITNLTKPFPVGPGVSGFFNFPTGTYPVHANIVNPLIDFPLITEQIQVFAVGDTVFLDSNKNGVQDPNEKGMSGIVLVLLNPDGTPAIGINGSPVLPVKTDSNGNYFFDDLPPGQYIIGVQVPKGVFVVPNSILDPLSDQTFPFTLSVGDPSVHPSTGFPVTAGLINPNIDIPLYAPSVSIGGIAWFDTNKNGIYDAGEPLIAGLEANIVRPTVNLPSDPDLSTITKLVVPLKHTVVSYETSSTSKSTTPYKVIKDVKRVMHALREDQDDEQQDNTTPITNRLVNETVTDTTTTIIDHSGNTTDITITKTNITTTIDPPLVNITTESPPSTSGSMEIPHNNTIVSLPSTSGGMEIVHTNMTSTDITGVSLPSTSGGLEIPQPNNITSTNITEVSIPSTSGGLEIPQPNITSTDTTGVTLPSTSGGLEISPINMTSTNITGISIPSTSDDLEIPLINITSTNITGVQIPTSSVGTFPSTTDISTLPSTIGITGIGIDTGPNNNNNLNIVNIAPASTFGDGIPSPPTRPFPSTTGGVTAPNPTDTTGTPIANSNSVDITPRVAPLPPDFIGNPVSDSSSSSMEPPTTPLVPNITTTNPPHYVQEYNYTIEDARFLTDSQSIVALNENTTIFVLEVTNTFDVRNELNQQYQSDPNFPNRKVDTVLYDFNGNLVKPTATDKRGWYKFDEMPNYGEYVISFRTPRSAWSVTRQTYWGKQTSLCYSGGITPPIDVKERGIKPLEKEGVVTNLIFPEANIGFIMADSYSVGDFVWYDDNSNGVSDTGELGVPGVTVSIYTVNNVPVIGTDGKVILPVVTDSNGHYMFHHVPTGVYHIMYSNLPPGYIFTKPYATGGKAGEFDSRANPYSNMTLNFQLDPNNPEVRLSSKFDNSSDTYINDYIDSGIIRGTYDNSQTYAVGRYVWFDDNQDRIRNDNEEGVPNVLVILFDRGGFTAIDADGNPVLPIKTDKNGYYVFDRLTPGMYFAQFFYLPNGYAFESGTAPNELTGRTPGFNLGPELPKVNPDTDGELKAVGIDRTENGGIIKARIMGFGDFVFYTGQDGKQVGVANITVSVLTGLGRTVLVNGTAVPDTKTDENGYYRFDGLVKGTYTVRWSTIPPIFSYFNPVSGRRTFDLLPDAPTVRPTRSTDFAPKSVLFEPTIDLELKPPNTFGIGDHVWFDLNEDGMAQPDEPPVPNVRVSLLMLVPQNLSFVPAVYPDGTPVDPVMTDSTGFYAFGDLPQGTYSLKFDQIPSDTSFTKSLVIQNDFPFSTPGPTGFTNPINLDPTNINLVSPPHGVSCDAFINRADAGLINHVVQIDTYAVGRIVWVDLNNNGVIDAGEPPVPDVTAQLLDVRGIPPIGLDGQPVKPTTTDKNGMYKFDQLPPGSYRVKFSNVPPELMWGDKTAVLPLSGLTRIFTLNPNSTRVHLTTPTDDNKSTYTDYLENGALIPLIKMAIGDYVWYDLNNNGKIDDGEWPVVGAALILTDSNGNVVQQTETDSSGIYHFDGLKPGIYAIRMDTLGNGFTNSIRGVDNKAANLQISSIFLSPYNNRSRPVQPSDGPLVATLVDPNEDIGVAKPPLFAIGDFVWRDLSRDGVYDGNEPPLSSVTVELHSSNDPNGPVLISPFTGKPYTAVTDDKGIYHIDGILPGSYIVKFTNIPQGSGFSPIGQDSQPNQQGFTHVFKLTTTNPQVTVVDPIFDGDLTASYILGGINAGVMIPAVPIVSRAVSGYAYYDQGNMGVKDPTDLGVNGVVQVRLVDGNGQLVTGPDGQTIQPQTVGPDGYYVFDNLAPGKYAILFTSPPILYQFYAPFQSVKNSLISDVDLTDNNPSLAPTYPLTDHTTIAQKILRDQNRGLVKITTFAIGDQLIVDPMGTTLSYNGAGVTVTLFKDSLPAFNISGVRIPPTVTNATGYYHFDNLPAGGGYAVEFSNLPDGWYYKPLLNIAKTLPAMFSRTYRTRTAALNTANPNVIPNTDPSVSSPYIDPTRDVVVAPILLSIGDLIFEDLSRPVTNTQDQMAPVSGITVQLLDASGNPAVNAFGTPVPSTSSNSLGNYKFDSLLPGSYMVKFNPTPTGLVLLQSNQGGDIKKDSNPNQVTGITSYIDLSVKSPDIVVNPIGSRDTSLAINPTIDAGYLRTSPTSGFISGKSFVDYNSDGIFNGLDKVYPGITVQLYDGPNLVATTVTDQNGAYIFNDLTVDRRYQVSFSNAPPAYYPTVLDNNREGSAIQYPTASKTNVNFGILRPYEYCQDNPLIGITCFVQDPPPAERPGSALLQPSEPVFITFPYGAVTTRSGDVNGKKTVMTIYNETNALYGVGFDRREHVWYSSPILKIGTKMRRSGTIYRIDGTSTTIYCDVNDLLGNSYNVLQTDSSAKFVYKSRFGDLDVVGDYIYITVLNQNTILKIPLRTTPTADNIQIIKPVNPCLFDTNFHIFGLGYDGVDMYVGGVCSMEINTTVVEFNAFVQKVDTSGTSTVPVLTFSLYYPRGIIQCRATSNCSLAPSANWRYWPLDVENKIDYIPQPQIGDITFIGYQGNMVISLKDRDSDTTAIVPAGDILYACKDASGNYVLESDGQCGGMVGVHTGPSGVDNRNEGPGGGEFFDDNFSNNQWSHDETMWGSSVYLQGAQEIVNTGYDLFNAQEGVVFKHSVTNGTKLGGFRVFDGSAINQMGKLNGLGDLDLGCYEAPLSVGDYVWNDVDQDGIQSSREPGFPGITVNLLSSEGTVVATTTTNSGGFYIFYNLIPQTPYQITFGPIPPGYVFSPQGVSVPATLPPDSNSKPDSTGSVTFTTGDPGQTMLSIDAGIYQS